MSEALTEATALRLISALEQFDERVEAVRPNPCSAWLIHVGNRCTHNYGLGGRCLCNEKYGRPVAPLALPGTCGCVNCKADRGEPV